VSLNTSQKQLVQSTFAKVAQIADQAAALFYHRLFEIDPSVQALFASTDMNEQRRKLMQVIGTAVGGLDRLDEIVSVVQALGIRHVSCGVKREHYAVVGEALLWTFEQGLGADFTPEVKAAWATVYGILAQTAIDAAYTSQEQV
jgi:hemoglobin-like flavoprotein